MNETILGTFFRKCTNHFHLYIWLFITLKKELVMSKCMTNPNFCEKRFSSVDGIIPMFMHGKKIRRKLPCSFLKTLITKSLTTYGIFKLRISQCLKITQNVSFVFLKLLKIEHFWLFYWTFVYSKCKILLASLAMLNETFSVIFKHYGTTVYINKASS